MTKEVIIIKSLDKHKELKGISVGNIAEELGLFPSDVEEVLKQMHSEGLIRCYLFEGRLFAVFEDSEIRINQPRNKNSIMYS